MGTFIQKNTLVSYYLLAVVITGVAVLPIILSAQGVISQSVSQEWHPLGALGPILAACLVVHISRGNSGLSAYMGSLRDTRFSKRLFLFSISPLLVFPILAVVIPLFSRPTATGVTPLSLAWGISLLVSSIAYGIGEESGWRGFALPRLQARMSSLSAIVILTVFHALWHIPFFFYRLQFRPGATIGFFVGMLAGGIIMTCLYNESGGKTLLPILFHTTWNIAAQVSLDTFPEVTYTLTTVQMIAAVLIVIVFRPTNLATRARYSVSDLST